MKCTKCDQELAESAKFCMECGSKTRTLANSSVADSRNAMLSSISLSPIPDLGLRHCQVKITKVEADYLNDDLSFAVRVHYTVTNDTPQDWEYLDIRAQLFSASGQILEESQDRPEITLEAGESQDFEIVFCGINAKILGSNPEQSHVVINVTASEFAIATMGEINIPDEPSVPCALLPVRISDSLRLISGSLWKMEPDKGRDCTIKVIAFVQNLVNRHSPKVRLSAKIIDKYGREYTDADTEVELSPGALAVLSNLAYAKESKFLGASVKLAFSAYLPVANGLDQRRGMTGWVMQLTQREPIQGAE